MTSKSKNAIGNTIPRHLISTYHAWCDCNIVFFSYLGGYGIRIWHGIGITVCELVPVRMDSFAAALTDERVGAVISIPVWRMGVGDFRDWLGTSRGKWGKANYLRKDLDLCFTGFCFLPVITTKGKFRISATCVTLYIKGVVGATPDLQSATPRCSSATPSQNHC